MNKKSKELFFYMTKSFFNAAKNAAESSLFNFNPFTISNKTIQHNNVKYITKYKGGDALKLNAYLREDSELPDDLMKISIGLDNELNMMPIYKGTVYRTLGFSRDIDYQKFLNEWRQGEIVTTKAYTSASKGNLYSDPTTMKYGVLMKLNSITGRNIENIGLNESEIVFSRGTKFAVRKTELQKTNAGSILFVAADEV